MYLKNSSSVCHIQGKILCFWCKKNPFLTILNKFVIFKSIWSETTLFMIIRNRHIIFFLFLILSLNVFPLNCDKSSLDSLKQLAFSREVDSLSKILTERILTKTDRALLYATLAEAYMELNNDSSFAMAKRGLDLAKELNDYKALAENYKVLGMLAYLNDSLHTAKL